MTQSVRLPCRFTGFKLIMSVCVYVFWIQLDWEDWEESSGEDEEEEYVPGSPASSTASFHSVQSIEDKSATAEVDIATSRLELGD